MFERLVEIIIPEANQQEMVTILKNYGIREFWKDKLSGKLMLYRVLSPIKTLESFLDLINRNFSNVKDFRIIVLPLNAYLPIRQSDIDSREKKRKKWQLKINDRMSREELLSSIDRHANLSWIFVLMIFLSAVVASIGLINDNVAVVIGAMVIAPFLGPNVALSLASTLGDFRMGKNALRSLLAGIFLAFALAAIIGFVFPFDPSVREIQSRAVISMGDVLLALAAGIAGVLSYTSGLSTSLIGVMVAVALLPPLVNSGLLIGAGYFRWGFLALLLFVSNLICINLTGVLTFTLQGVRPRTWWEAKKARKATRLALLTWSVLLLILILILVVISKS